MKTTEHDAEPIARFVMGQAFKGQDGQFIQVVIGLLAEQLGGTARLSAGDLRKAYKLTFMWDPERDEIVITSDGVTFN